MYCRNVDMMRMNNTNLTHPRFAETYDAIILFWEQGCTQPQKTESRC